MRRYTIQWFLLFILLGTVGRAEIATSTGKNVGTSQSIAQSNRQITGTAGVNEFDRTLIASVNQYSQRSRVFDKTIDLLSKNHLFKGGVFMTLFWWLWFRGDGLQAVRRTHILITLGVSVVNMAFVRVIALMAPLRLRPLYEPGLGFRIPLGENPHALDGWSSFPSDHAGLFFGLATGLLFVSRRIGVFTLIYTTVFIALPRIYLGLHYPTDILVGAISGIGLTLAANFYLAQRPAVQVVMGWSNKSPGEFYAIFFLFTFQVADMFDNVRSIFEALYGFLRTVTGHS